MDASAEFAVPSDFSKRNHEIIRRRIMGLNMEAHRLSEVKVVTVKLPKEVYDEMALRIPEGDRSGFIRDAINEKLQNTPKPDRILALEQRLERMEQEFGQIKKYLADLEILTFQHGKINPHSFCIDDLDHKIMEYLLHYKSATTPELAEYLNVNRWLVLNRLRKIQRNSKKQAGKAIVEYYAGEKSGKKKAWWIDEELIEE
jgi:Arc/MetJ-type ribon-helix-helix transcriptional regulator